MKATKLLKDEHQGILLMLDIVEAVNSRLNKGNEVDPDHLKSIVEFIRVFADKCHHAKEEDLLFPAMEKAGVPNEGGPIGMMLIEHDEGRGYVKGMAEAITDYENHDPKAGKKFAKNAQNYVDLLRQHIDKEDNILYEIADMHLSNKEQNRLVKDFERVEIERIGKGRHEEFHQLLSKFKKIYL